MPVQWPRAILHVDVDAFHTSVHARDDESIRGKPVAVAGSGRRATVLGASFEARASGVLEQMPVEEAQQLCPELVVIRSTPAAYREASRALQGIFRRFAAPEKIQLVDHGEAYLDVTARTRGSTTPEEIARQLKFMIRNELRLTASVGVAVGKVVAKVASGSRRPDGLVVVAPGSEPDFMAALAVGSLPGVGPKTEERLRLLGIRRVADLAGYDTQRLVQALGAGGAVLQKLAQGKDREPVDGSKPPKTLSAEITFDHDVADRERIEEAVQDLTARLAERLREAGVKAKTVYVKVKLPDFRLVSRQVSRTSATDDADVIFRAARSALEKSHLESRPVRLVGVGLSGLEHPRPELQLSLFD